MFACTVCAGCGRRTRWSFSEAGDRLRSMGMLKRSAPEDHDTLWELWRSSLARVGCEACAHVGLTLLDGAELQREMRRPDDGDWPEARACQGCGCVLPPERLELFPDTTRCAGCVAVADEAADVDFCPRCGAALQLRWDPNSSQYRSHCSGCRYRS